jgi:hypothetical protein
MSIIVFKLLLALADGLLGVLVLRTGALDRWDDGQFLRRMVALQIVPALALFGGLYFVGHQEVPSDVPAYYMPAAHAVLAGKLPFRDFTSSYAPLFPYLGGALLSIWDSGKMFALFSILVNAVALLLWDRLGKACLEKQTARQSTLLFATSGNMLLQSLLGTNQTWIGAALAASTLLIVLERPTGSGLVQALSVAITKVLALLFWPVLWICTRHRGRWLAAAVLPAFGLYAAFAATGADIFYPLRFEGELSTSGNLPYVLAPLLSMTGPVQRHAFDALALVALGGTTLWIYLRARRLSPQQRAMLLPLAIALTGLVFLVFSKKSYTGYVVFFMYPLMMALGVGMPRLRTRIGFALAFNALLATEPSLWFRLGGDSKTLPEWLKTGGGPAIAGFVLLDLALLACYVWLAWLSVGSIRRTTAGAMRSRNASQSETACSLV